VQSFDMNLASTHPFTNKIGFHIEVIAPGVALKEKPKAILHTP